MQIMIAIYYLKRYKGMVLTSIFFFYLGCVITVNFMNIECASTISTVKLRENNVSTCEDTEYVVLIISSPDNEVKRDAVRATWGNFINNIFIENGEKLYKWNHTWIRQSVQPNFIKILFVLGTKNLGRDKLKKLNSEHSRSNDLLLFKTFEDTYKNLSSKVIISLDWLSKHFKKLKYVIKCDDDSFVRVDLIVKDLEAFAPRMDDVAISSYVTFKKYLPSYKGLYWGYFHGGAKINLIGKWQEKDWFLSDTYLPYALGGGYIISRSIIDYIAQNLNFLSTYTSEDVSMGVWTAALDGVNRVHDTRFDTQWKSRGCDTSMLIRHKQTPSDMFKMYKTLVHSQGKKLCKTESTLRKSYSYNWNVVPSECCK